MRTFRGEEIPKNWQIDGQWENAEIPPWTIIGTIPPVREDKRDPAQVIVWEGSICVAMSRNRYERTIR